MSRFEREKRHNYVRHVERILHGDYHHSSVFKECNNFCLFMCIMWTCTTLDLCIWYRDARSPQHFVPKRFLPNRRSPLARSPTIQGPWDKRSPNGWSPICCDTRSHTCYGPQTKGPWFWGTWCARSLKLISKDFLLFSNMLLRMILKGQSNKNRTNILYSSMVNGCFLLDLSWFSNLYIVWFPF